MAILVLAAWFQRRRSLPPVVAVIGVLVGTLAMGSVGAYRDITMQHDRPTWTEISRINIFENFSQVMAGGATEMRNAVQLINAADRDMIFDFGGFHWNVLVYNYIPAQVVGYGVKATFVLDLPRPDLRDYHPAFGTTETGMADAFTSFWWFGAVKFLLISVILSRTWRAAMNGSAMAQIIYMFSATAAMHAVSHHTQWLFSAWIHMALFLMPALSLARAREPVGQRGGWA